MNVNKIKRKKFSVRYILIFTVYICLIALSLNLTSRQFDISHHEVLKIENELIKKQIEKNEKEINFLKLELENKEAAKEGVVKHE